MTQPQFLSLTLLLLHLTAQTGLILRAIMRPHREPASRIAWVLVILVFPVVGILSYLLLGEVSIGRGRALRLARSEARLPPPAALTPAVLPADLGGSAEAVNPSVSGPGGGVGPRQICHDLFKVGESISGFVPCGGNLGQLAADSDHAITGLVADIDAARDQEPRDSLLPPKDRTPRGASLAPENPG
jgi:cardiolipin synthase